MRHFAEQGYHAARVGDIAAMLGIAKGSIFQHFGSKDGLFFEVYKKAVRSFPRYLDAPAEVRESGFFEVLRYWLVRTEHLLHEDWIPYRVSLLGNYGTDLTLKREINRFLMAEDPYGTVAFVRWIAARKPRELDQDMISGLRLTMGASGRSAHRRTRSGFSAPGIPPLKEGARIAQFLDALKRAIEHDGKCR
jgi:AcrR family transcriptional regulator